MNPILEVRDLCKAYDQVQAIDQISLSVRPGEAVALLGPNGSGKTTTLRCVAGLLHPDSGNIRICGIDSRVDPRSARRLFSFLPQLASFPGNLQVREIVEFHGKLRGASLRQIEDSLESARISEENQQRLVSELSGGMRQRLALAIAGIPEVPLMLLDEPTANLDPEAAIRLRRLARHWRNEGRSLLFSTHVLADVEELADRVVVLVGGNAVVQESVGRLRADIQNFASLRVDVGKPTAGHVRVALEAGASDARLNSHSILITAPVGIRYSILKRLGELGEIRHFETEEPSVEHIYLKYVRNGENKSA